LGFNKGFLLSLKGWQDSPLVFVFFITHQFGFTNPSRDLGKSLSDLENYPILMLNLSPIVQIEKSKTRPQNMLEKILKQNFIHNKHRL
jgi:hypothetical protein